MGIKKVTSSSYRKSTKGRSKNRQPEYELQKAVCNYLTIKYNKVFYNGSAGGMWTALSVAMRMKKSGYKAGFPDLFIYEPNEKYHGLAIELKCKGNYASAKQKEVLKKLNDKGYFAKVCTGLDDAIDTIDNYLNNTLE